MDIRRCLQASILWAPALRMKGLRGHPRAPPLYYVCPYLLGNREEPLREEHHCLRASEHGLSPWGENRAVSGLWISVTVECAGWHQIHYSLQDHLCCLITESSQKNCATSTRRRPHRRGRQGSHHLKKECVLARVGTEINFNCISVSIPFQRLTYFMHIRILPARMSVHHTSAWCRQRPEESRFPGTVGAQNWTCVLCKSNPKS